VLAGRVLFWLSWPLLWLYLPLRPRTRLLLVCDGEFLTVQGWLSDGRWALPGGGLRFGETPLDGVRRETEEETGIILPASEVKFLYRGMAANRGPRFRCHCFYAELPQKPAVRPGRAEINAISWQSLSGTLPPLTADAATALQKWHATR
jgi:8-oxo-dGTP diphosphatase